MVIRHCLVCGKKVLRRPHQLKKQKNVFCSMLHLYQWRSSSARRSRVYIKIAEAALGRKLPSESIVHHIDGNRSNNDNSNLVILQNNTEHRIIHVKMRAMKLGVDFKIEKLCPLCNQIKPLSSFCNRAASKTTGKQCYCMSCDAIKKAEKRMIRRKKCL